MAEKEVLSVKEVAELLGCSPARARRLLNGKVPDVPRISHMRGGRVRLVRRVVVLAWLETLKQVDRRGQRPSGESTRQAESWRVNGEPP